MSLIDDYDSLDSGIHISEQDLFFEALDSEELDVANWINNVFLNLPKIEKTHYEVEGENLQSKELIESDQLYGLMHLIKTKLDSNYYEIERI
ncbi:unnamed protein product, partial [Brachionus calyciflorus]